MTPNVKCLYNYVNYGVVDMNANINKIVNDISKTNILERIVYEATLNSIHAESTNIECIFEYIDGIVQSEFKTKKWGSKRIEIISQIK